MHNYKTIWLIGSVLCIIANGNVYSQTNYKAPPLLTNHKTEISTNLAQLNDNDSASVAEYKTNRDSLFNENTPDKTSKIFYQGNLRGSLGLISHQSETIGFDIVNSVSVANIVAVGLGAGLRFPLDREVISVPLYLDFRLTLSQNSIAPIIEIGWGGTFQPNLNYEHAGQILLCQAGAKIEGSQKFSLMITVGYERYDIITPYQSSYTNCQFCASVWQPRAKWETISAGTLNFGFIF